MTSLATSITASAWSALGGTARGLDRLRFRGEGELPSSFAVTDAASAAVAVAALAVSELADALGGTAPPVTVDRRLASMWFAWTLRPLGWSLPATRDPLTRDYRAQDGWIRIHANAPHHRAVAETVLGCRGTAADAAHRVSRWLKADLESALVAAGGCAAEMRSMGAWLAHPQGRAIRAEPLVLMQTTGDASGPGSWAPALSRPLAGVRVLDLTRVLAGPVATRFLAGFGANILRIDPPGWNEPGVVPEITLGKRCARLDLRSAGGRATFESLLATTDVLVHGYRPSALDRLGYDAASRRRLSPGLIDVSLDAYGWSGPWGERRGFDSLVQMSAGIAQTGMARARADRPVPLPVQALDHATGYLAAAAAIRGLTQRLETGRALRARLSLARTAMLLIDTPGGAVREPVRLAPESCADLAEGIEATSWGSARRLKPPVAIGAIPMHWSLPATALGTASAGWSP